MRPPLVVGNWKMHGSQAECEELARGIATGIRGKQPSIELALAPPYTALEIVKKVIGKKQIALAAQD